MASNMQNPIFQDETKAREWLEARVWPKGPICPHCGNVDHDKIKALKGKVHRAGLYQCAECREQFTVTVKTVFERSKIPLSKWLAALFMLTSSKKGVSTHQVHRTIGVSYKSTWFMMHRLREALRDGGFSPMGGPGKIVEADETFYGKLEGQPKRSQGSATTHKNTILSLVERGGNVRSFHVADTTMGQLLPVIYANVAKETAMMTDEWRSYNPLGKHFVSHETVKHSAYEYVRGHVTTNTVEGYFSVFKRGMRGTYQHCKEKHLHRYLAEFDFRFNTRTSLGFNDLMRAELAVKGIVGKRLTYRRPDSQSQVEAH
jgi:transposase-like protein